jgi:hypothetical protein
MNFPVRIVTLGLVCSLFAAGLMGYGSMKRKSIVDLPTGEAAVELAFSMPTEDIGIPAVWPLAASVPDAYYDLIAVAFPCGCTYENPF